MIDKMLLLLFSSTLFSEALIEFNITRNLKSVFEKKFFKLYKTV